MQQETTELLRRVREGDSSAPQELMDVVYSELHRIARQRLRRERHDHTLQPTALVNETYLRMFGKGGAEFADRAHFLAFASRVMRHILVDYARERGAAKRGGWEQPASLDLVPEVAVDGVKDVVQLLDLDMAIEAMATENPNPAQVIEMRYFGGMTAQETAEAVGRSIHIVQHELRFAQAWLRRRLAAASAPLPDPASRETP